MPTLFSHSIAAAALVTAFPKDGIPRRLALAGILCAVAPDVDTVATFFFGYHPDSFVNHRGFTHSLVFAATFASATFLALRLPHSPPVKRGLVFLYLLLAAASHGLLDAMTDRNGLGIPFFWPFDTTRYFFPFAPIAMSPLGINFFSARGFSVLLSEIRWVWIPSLLFAAMATSVRHFCAARNSAANPTT